MIPIAILLGLAYFITVSESAKLIDTRKCPGGCKRDQDCTSNSECRYLDDVDDCGYCMCSEGYRAQGSKCVPVKYHITTSADTTTSASATTSTPTSTATSVSTSTTATTTSTTPTTTTTTTHASTTPGTTTQGPPPIPIPLYCPEYECAAFSAVATKDANPLQVRHALVNITNPSPGCKRKAIIPPRPCNVQGGSACYGIYCLTESPGNDYCICPYYRVDRSCAIDKPGSCSAASGIVPLGSVHLHFTRLRNKNAPDQGSVYARHFAPTLYDCVRLCQWTRGQCRSVNYGEINGVNVCELMSIVATRKSLLASWLNREIGWEYVQLAPAV